MSILYSLSLQYQDMLHMWHVADDPQYGGPLKFEE
jgi:hypothetical protein